MDICIKEEKKYKIVKTIQDNGNVKLHMGMDCNYQRYVAIKEIIIDGDKKSNSAIVKIAQNKITTMINLSDKTTRIPCILDTFFDDESNRIYIIMQWINGENLTEKMNSADNYDFLEWMIDLCDTLYIMAEKRIHHKDIKPDNIMIDEAKQMYLIDFNISISTPNLIYGTKNYRAPEMESNFTNDFSAVDVFAIGVIMYQFFTGVLPVNGIEYSVKRRFGNRGKSSDKWGKFKEPIEINKTIPKKINDIIVKCMSMSPNDRYGDFRQLKRELVQAKKGFGNGRKNR